MTTRIFAHFLLTVASLLFALSVQAGEISMAADGSQARGEPTSTGSASSSDCPPVSSSAALGHARVSDKPDDTTTAAPSSGASATNSMLTSPVKVRGNRWQSLVPGAIK